MKIKKIQGSLKIIIVIAAVLTESVQFEEELLLQL